MATDGQYNGYFYCVKGTVHDAVLTMGERNIGSLIVTEAKEGIVGIVTERDILKKVSPRTELRTEMMVRDVMSSHIMCIHPSTTVIEYVPSRCAASAMSLLLFVTLLVCRVLTLC